MPKWYFGMNSLQVATLRELSTPCRLWLLDGRSSVTKVVFCGFAMRDGTEEIVKWLTPKGHWANCCVFRINKTVFFYLDEEMARLGALKYSEEDKQS
jgi:hypothetical protein